MLHFKQLLKSPKLPKNVINLVGNESRLPKVSLWGLRLATFSALGQKRGLVLVRQGWLVVTERRSNLQELLLTDTFDIWETSRGRI